MKRLIALIAATAALAACSSITAPTAPPDQQSEVAKAQAALHGFAKAAPTSAGRLAVN
jgi:hypothetical protein